jgi:hypothetical protein
MQPVSLAGPGTKPERTGAPGGVCQLDRVDPEV